MARINIPGLIYLHFLIFFFAALSILALKDVNFSNPSTVPSIGDIQGWVMIFSFLCACTVLLVMFIHGFAVRDLKLGILGSISLFLIYSALLFLIGLGLYPKLFEGATNLQMTYRMLLVPVASAFILLGSLIFIVIKFPDNRERRWFMMAVRQEMKSPSRGVCPVCATVVSMKAPLCYKCKTKLH